MMAVPYIPSLSAPTLPRDLLKRWHRLTRRCIEAGVRHAPSELRVDVEQRPEQLQAELEELFERMNSPGDALHGLPTLELRHSGFAFRYRQADGEHYVYVQDLARGRLAGYTVFNRLIELNRRTERHLRAPHSKYARIYQRRGIASTIYSWWLDAGNCLISGARQSDGAHALWRSLGVRYRLICVEVRDKSLRYLGDDIAAYIKQDLQTRLILVGAGYTAAQMESRMGLHVTNIGEGAT